MKAVIPCGGRGLRFLPITKEIPKEILPIVDVPVISYLVNECVESDIDEIIIVISPSKTVIKDYFTSHRLYDELISAGKFEQAETIKKVLNNANISFVVQNQPRGLADAIMQTKYYVGSQPFCVLLGDDLVISDRPVARQLTEAFDSCGATIVGVQKCLSDDITKYGVSVPVADTGDKLLKIKKFVEKPPLNNVPSRLACYGRYLLKDVFRYIEGIKPSVSGELMLTDALTEQCADGGVYSYTFDGVRYDMGDKFSSLKAAIELSLNRKDFGSELKQYLLQLTKSL